LTPHRSSVYTPAKGLLTRPYPHLPGKQWNEEAIAMTAERAPALLAERLERLERGEIITYARCPFALPEGDDCRFLMQQPHSRWVHKNICYDPHTGRVRGFRRRTARQAERLRGLLAEFAGAATAWLAKELPHNARAWQPDRASLRNEEEATRRLRLTARNDLLHIDAFPTRPALGRRLLRLFVNLNPTEPRVWATSEPFARLLERYGAEVGLPRPGMGRRGGFASLLSFLASPFLRGRPSDYDGFMLRFHDFLKLNDHFQDRSPKRYWYFPPGSAWLVFADGVSHAVLRGRHALEHSYFIAQETLVLPAESPAILLTRRVAPQVQRRAA
jgi:hypothetical protein